MRLRTHWRVWRRFTSFGRSLRWEEECELQPGWRTASWETPTWGRGTGSDIVGEWLPVRRRLTWFTVPVTPWRPL